jgi:hypothetical protein
MAKTIPGKEEFHETIRYFNKQVHFFLFTPLFFRPARDHPATGKKLTQILKILCIVTLYDDLTN